MDVPRLVHADEADVVAVAAMHAGHLREPPPRRAIISGDLRIEALKVRRIGNDATSVVAGDAGPRPADFRCGGTCTQRHGKNSGSKDGATPTHYNALPDPTCTTRQKLTGWRKKLKACVATGVGSGSSAT